MRSLDGSEEELLEESKWLLLMVKRRSGGIGIPEAMYLKIRAWCSSSCHCVAVKGNLLMLFPLITNTNTNKKTPITKTRTTNKETRLFKKSKERMRDRFRLQGKTEKTGRCVVVCAFKCLCLCYVYTY